MTPKKKNYTSLVLVFQVQRLSKRKEPNSNERIAWLEATHDRWKSCSVKPQRHRNQAPLPRMIGLVRCTRARRACRWQARELLHYLVVCAHERWAVYGKIQSRYPWHREQTRADPSSTVSRLQGYPVSRASKPRELPYGAYSMHRTRKDRQGLPVVNGRRCFCRPVSKPSVRCCLRKSSDSWRWIYWIMDAFCWEWLQCLSRITVELHVTRIYKSKWTVRGNYWHCIYYHIYILIDYIEVY